MPMSRMRLALLAAATLSVALGALQPITFYQGVLARTAVTRDSPLAALLKPSDTIEAIVTLGSEPVAAMLKRASVGADRIDLESDQAHQYEQRLESQQSDFITQALEVAPGLRIKGQLRVLANAISLDMRRPQLDAIAALPGVRSVEIARTCHVLLNRSVPLISAPALWTRLGGPSLAGNGIKIAIIDTGIDISSPLMSDQGMTAPQGFPQGDTRFTNNKVIVAKAFLPGSNPSPADGFGHGTSVAGVAAGSLNTPTIVGPISGVAPRSYLGNYRVLDENGVGSEFQVTAGLEEAVKDGFDIANISLGLKSTGTLSLLGNAVEKAVAAGMIVVVAAGNQGADGKQTIDSPAEAPSAIAVGASGNQHRVGSGLIVGGAVPPPDELQLQSGILACCSNLGAVIGPLPCVDISTMVPAHEGCNGLPSGSLTGKIALLQNSRSDCLMLQKLTAARAAGAGGAVIFSLDSTVGISPAELEPASLPSILIDRVQGRALRSWVREHPGAPAIISPAVEFPNDPQLDVSQNFSSLGPSGLGQL